MIVTLRELVAAKACGRGLTHFTDLFGQQVEVTAENLRRAWTDLDHGAWVRWWAEACVTPKFYEAEMAIWIRRQWISGWLSRDTRLRADFEKYRDVADVAHREAVITIILEAVRQKESQP